MNENILNSGSGRQHHHARRGSGPGRLGQSVTFTALVTPGTRRQRNTDRHRAVRDRRRRRRLGDAERSPGLDEATFSTSSLAAGSHTVTAVYSGDTNFNGSISPSI